MKIKEMPFTPIDKTTGKRLKMRLDPETDIPRGHHWKRRVKDLNTGTEYIAEGAPCNLPNCYCDAVVTPVKKSVIEQLGEVLAIEYLNKKGIELVSKGSPFKVRFKGKIIPLHINTIVKPDKKTRLPKTKSNTLTVILIEGEEASYKLKIK